MSDISQLADEMAQAAGAYLASLSPEQRAKANPPFEDEDLRRSWYYTPSERAGLPMVEMRPTQRALALRLLTTGLSETGFNAVATVMGLENVLDRQEEFSDRPYAGRNVEAAHVDELFARPPHPYTRGLMAAVPRLGSSLEGSRRKLAEIPGMVPSLREAPIGCTFAPRCAFATDRCRAEYPLTEDAGRGHLVACWNWRTVASEGRPA